MESILRVKERGRRIMVNVIEGHGIGWRERKKREGERW
jgi:hypothetical protein